MMSTDAGVNVLETDVLTMKNSPASRLAPLGKVEMLVMNSVTLVPWYFHDC